MGCVGRAIWALVIVAATACGGGGGNGSGASTGGTGAASGAGGAGGTGGAASGGTGAAAGAGGAGAASGGGGSSGASGGTGGSAGGACSGVTTFADGAVPTTEVHVSPTGNDQGAGTSASPFATLGKAASVAGPGTAIRLQPGTYGGGAFLSNLSGTATAPIWIGGVTGSAKPVIDGGGQAMQLSRVRYLIVHDLEVRNSTQNGINIDDGADYANEDATRYVVFRNLTISDIGSGGNQDCLKMSGVNDFWVLDSTFTNCSSGGSGIDMVGCHRGLIAGNTFTDMGSNAVQGKGGTDDVEIRHNRIKNGGQRAINLGGSTGFQFFRPPLSTSAPNFEARNIRVVANLIEGSMAPIAFVGCVSCVAAQNTIVNPTNWIIRILQETNSGSGYTFEPAKDGVFENNLVYFARGGLSTYVNVGANTDAPSFTFRTNLWYAHDNAAQSQPTNLPAAESGGIYGQDPGVAAPDFVTSAGSPAVGQGTHPAHAPGDLLGKCWKNPPSIGAYEGG